MNWSVPWSVDWLTDRLIGLDWLIRKRTPSIFSFSTSTFMLFLRQESWFVRRWVHRHHNIQDFVVVGSDSLELSLARAATSIIFVATKMFMFCRDKLTFVATKHVFCRDKSMLVATNGISVSTKVLSRQAYFCRDKTRLLSRQTRVCRDKTFAATTMILVAAPANDIEQDSDSSMWTGWYGDTAIDSTGIFNGNLLFLPVTAISLLLSTDLAVTVVSLLWSLICYCYVFIVVSNLLPSCSYCGYHTCYCHVFPVAITPVIAMSFLWILHLLPFLGSCHLAVIHLDLTNVTWQSHICT